MPTDDIAIPVTVTVIVMGIYIVGGAVVFSEWEDWDILSSIYFTWVKNCQAQGHVKRDVKTRP